MGRSIITPSLYVTTSDAAFRACGLAISNSLAAAGLVLVAQTPANINWATVTKPVAANTWAGTEIWRLNDALQGTAPIFIKVYYGTASTASSYFTCYMAVGFDNDGAGNIMGINQYGRTFANLATADGTGYQWYVSGDGSGVVLHTQHTKANDASFGGCVLAIERTRDAAGVIDSRGVYFFQVGVQSLVSKVSCFIPRNVNLLDWQVAGIAYAGVNGTSLPYTGNGADGNKVNMFPLRVMSKSEQIPMSLVYGIFQTDLTLGNPIPITRWDGLVKTFMPLGDYRYPLSPGQTSANLTGCAIYWEA